MPTDTAFDHTDSTAVTHSPSDTRELARLTTSATPDKDKVSQPDAKLWTVEEPSSSDSGVAGVTDSYTVTDQTEKTTSIVVTRTERAESEPGRHAGNSHTLQDNARSDLGAIPGFHNTTSEDLPATASTSPESRGGAPLVDTKHIVPVSVIGGDNDSLELPHLPQNHALENISLPVTTRSPDLTNVDVLPSFSPRSSPDNRSSITQLSTTMTVTPVTMPPSSPDTTQHLVEQSTARPHPRPTQAAVTMTTGMPRVDHSSPRESPVYHSPIEVTTLPTHTGEMSSLHASNDNVTSAGMIFVPDKTTNTKIIAIVTPVILGVVILILVGVIIALLYRRNRRHRKQNIIKYKRYSQNGDVSLPLTAVSNDNYRSSRVSAHEEAVVYSQVDKTLRPPRPTYRYKTLSQSSSTTDHNHGLWHTFPRQHNNNNIPDDLETTLVDNCTYEGTLSSPSPPKVPVRKSSSEQESLKRTPGSPKKEISWPIPKGDSPVNGGLRTYTVIAPPLPPSPRHGPPAHRPIPPSPRSLPATPSTSRSVPTTPPSPSQHAGLPSLPPPPRGRRHEYDPVYVPSSDALGMNQRLDNAGYVTSRRMRMQALLGPHQPYEDVQLAGSSSETGCVSSTSSSPSRSHDSAVTSPESPASVRTTRVSESDGADLTSGDRSFDTLGTEGSNNRAHFSLEDITNVISDSSSAAPGGAAGDSTDGEVEYSVIPVDYSDSDTQHMDNLRTQAEDSDGEREDVYETVNF